MNKAFTNFEWKDEPDHTTPLSAANLNKINDGLDTVDDRVLGIAVKQTSISLTVAGWSLDSTGLYKQNITISGSTSTTKVDLTTDDTLSEAMADNGITAMYVVNNGTNIVCYAKTSTAPTAAMNVNATYYDVNGTGNIIGDVANNILGLSYTVVSTWT